MAAAVFQGKHVSTAAFVLTDSSLAITVRLSMAEMGAARTVKFVRLHLVLVKMLNTLLVPGTAIVAVSFLLVIYMSKT